MRINFLEFGWQVVMLWRCFACANATPYTAHQRHHTQTKLRDEPLVIWAAALRVHQYYFDPGKWLVPLHPQSCQLPSRLQYISAAHPKQQLQPRTTHKRHFAAMQKAKLGWEETSNPISDTLWGTIFNSPSRGQTNQDTFESLRGFDRLEVSKPQKHTQTKPTKDSSFVARLLCVVLATFNGTGIHQNSTQLRSGWFCQ